ncbi:PadR family transcriptional regulator [Paenibacillus sp. y28]|uniref:PadR family transcriptional regulator n=1 Tax=Paenibacillus sp. y28 TaxID=3129110 RepID=UPI0030173D71
MKISKELLKGSTVTLILSQLQQQDMYGYELAKAIEQRSSGAFALKEGTLYPLLHTLEQNGVVEAYWQEHDGRKRKYYRLTSSGKELLQEKKQEWSLFRSAVDQVLGEGRA